MYINSTNPFRPQCVHVDVRDLMLTIEKITEIPTKFSYPLNNHFEWISHDFEQRNNKRGTNINQTHWHAHIKLAPEIMWQYKVLAKSI